MGKVWRATAKNQRAQAKVARAEVGVTKKVAAAQIDNQRMIAKAEAKRLSAETKAFKKESGIGVVAALRPRPGPSAPPSAPVSTPAGWHRDPHGRHEMRYWDGARWTDHVSDSGATGLDPA